MKGYTPEMQRRERIQAIKKTLKAVQEQGLEFSKDKFLLEIQGNYGVTEKVANDYFKVAEGTI